MAGLASSLKVPSEEVPARVANLVERLKAAEKELERARRGGLTATAVGIEPERIGDVRVVAQRMPAGMTAADLRSVVGDIRGNLGSDPAVARSSPKAKAAPYLMRSPPTRQPRTWASGRTNWSSSSPGPSTVGAAVRPTSRRAPGRIRRASTRRSTRCAQR